jgi:hypothetical protein
MSYDPSAKLEVECMCTKTRAGFWMGLSLTAVGALFFNVETHAQGRRNTVPTDLPGLSAEVAKIEGFLPNQSHVMADVSFQFSNLWFAGLRKNWPLAQFFYNETRNRVRWMIRINPIVQDPDKKDVDLQAIFDAVDKDVWSSIKTAIDEKDIAKFQTAYKLGLDKGCYSCHKSVGRPYLRPQVPTQPPSTIINFDPNAKWPE